MKLVSVLSFFSASQISFFPSGHGLTVQHIRYNSECDVYEELEPIDRNLKYDFNFQQITHLQREVIIEPVDFCNLSVSLYS